MGQLSFFSAERDAPSVEDLGGLLAASGQIVQTGGSARISVVVDAMWRANAILAMFDEADLRAQLGQSDEGNPLVRSLTSPELLSVAVAWTKGAIKTPPDGWVPSPRALRLWVLAGGWPGPDERYHLPLDPHVPDSFDPLATALMRVGIAPMLIGTRGSTPALRIVGHRRLERLAENVGHAPEHPDANLSWPHG